MIIGLTGSYCAGKDVVAEYLIKEKGFVHFSLSDELRRELELRNIDTVRANLIKIGTELRSLYGNSILAKRIRERVLKNTNYVITSIRHPDEIYELRNEKNFYLVNVDAPSDLRFKRMQKRCRKGDPENFKEFLEFEKKESQTEGSGQQLKKCSEMAEYIIVNDTDKLEELYTKINLLMSELNPKIATKFGLNLTL